MLNLVKVLIIFSFGIVSCKDGSDNMKSDFQGKSLENLQKTKLFKNFISLRELNLGDGYYSFLYEDTVTNSQFILLCQEETYKTEKDQKLIVKDLLKLSQLNENEYVDFGSIEQESKELFVIAIEVNKQALASKSQGIRRAWIFSPEENKFKELDVTGLYRLNEGYYKK
ncbi:hypothetical protein [Echinicola vietnamensis]|uniref:Lipoprotein n=1 Tax=Echinicola vietnamensis (strain DSM 17526 / LMG 23754 / KMM 6221) TaxID=926556 RepID=L0FYU8_ECHVK|nr:hypothetical protein [Echinicola vietnamensis]AGA78218.1 hypothetical protein Echvi_1964 [Echinicola vietnamensis DSM 17526]